MCWCCEMRVVIMLRHSTVNPLYSVKERSFLWTNAHGSGNMRLTVKQTYMELVICDSLNTRAIFFFPVTIGHEIRIRWSFAQICCAMSLVCPSIGTNRTCQFWAHSEPVNMPKTIESPTKCGVRAVIRFLYFRTSDEECCPQVLPFFMTILGRILQLQQRDSWSVFDGKCLITRHHPPGFGALRFSSLSPCETVVGGQHFGT